MHAQARLFKTLSDPTRLRLLLLLLARGEETCVCLLAQALGAADFKISRHLAVLRSAGLVKARRRGTWMYYRPASPPNPFAAQLMKCLLDGLRDHKVIQADLKRLARAQCKLKD